MDGLSVGEDTGEDLGFGEMVVVVFRVAWHPGMVGTGDRGWVEERMQVCLA